MKIGIAKKIVCEVERYPMQAPFKLVDENLQKDQWRSYVLSKLDDQENIREIVEKHPYKKESLFKGHKVDDLELKRRLKIVTNGEIDGTC
jgi:hypothetical protein